MQQGEILGLLGPSGAGKTITLEMIGRLRKAGSGTVLLLRMNPWPRNARLLPRIGVELQAWVIFEQLTAADPS